MAQATLTAKERQTLNDALAIIDRCTAQGASWSISAHRYDACPFGFSITYFDSNVGPYRGQHDWVRGETLADKVQTILGIEARASSNKEEQRQARLARLRSELAEAEAASA